MNLSSTIKSIQDIMRKDDGVDGDAQRIGQLTWMLFLKIFDQCEETWEDDAADKRQKYKSPLPEDCRWRNWAKYIEDDKGKKKPRIQASELIRHVNDIVFPGLQNLDIEGNPKAQRKGVFIADAAPWQQSETSGDKSGGQLVQRGAGALKAGLGGDDAPLMRTLLPETGQVDVITEDFVLPHEALEVVERQRVVQVRRAIFPPTDSIATGGGLGIFDPAAGGRVEGHVMLAPAFPLGRGEV